MFCLYCGTEIPDDAVFCYRCGKQQSNQPPDENVPKAQGIAHISREATVEKYPLGVGSLPTVQSISDSEGKTRNLPPNTPNHTSDITGPVTTSQPNKRRMSPLLGVALLILLLVAGGIGVYLYSSQHQAPTTGGVALAHTTAQQFCDLLVHNDYSSAYTMLIPNDFSNLSDFESKIGNAINSGYHNGGQLTSCSINSNPQQDWQQEQSLVFIGTFNFSDYTETGFQLELNWNQNAHRYDIDAWMNGNFLIQ